MADLSSGATERIVIKRFEALPVAAKNFVTHITAKKIMNCFEQLTGQAPAIAWPPVPSVSWKDNIRNSYNCSIPKFTEMLRFKLTVVPFMVELLISDNEICSNRGFVFRLDGVVAGIQEQS